MRIYCRYCQKQLDPDEPGTLFSEDQATNEGFYAHEACSTMFNSTDDEVVNG